MISVKLLHRALHDTLAENPEAETITIVIGRADAEKLKGLLFNGLLTLVPVDLGEESTLKADGFDDAIIGQARPVYAGGAAVLVYSVEKIIDILAQRDGMDRDDALEFFDFNIEPANVGPETPIFLMDFDKAQLNGPH